MHGAVRVESYTDPATNLLEYAPWRVATRAGVRSFVPRSGRWQGPGLVVELGTEDGGLIADRESAAALMDADIRVPRSALPPPAPGEVYLFDLIGLPVRGADGHDFGAVEKILDNGVQPVLQCAPGGVLIPFVRGPIVLDTDLEAGEIRLAWTAEHAL